MIAWWNRLSVPAITVDPSSPLGQIMAEHFTVPGLSFRLFDITTDAGLPAVLCVALEERDTGCSLTVGAACRPDPAQAALKALIEAAKGRNTQRLVSHLSGPLQVGGWDELRSLDDHARLYARHDMRPALRFLLETLLGNDRLVRQMQSESPDFLVDDTLPGLAAKMNALTASHDVESARLEANVERFDRQFAKGLTLGNDDQLRRIQQARQWRPDRLRTCAPKPLRTPGAGPFIAIRMQLITRKSLGGLRTDLDSRVLGVDGAPIPGLWCVGEAAGFGGGGAHGRRSLEGTFLPACILTARAAVRALRDRN